VTIVITVFAFVLSMHAIAVHLFKSLMAWRPLERVSRRSATSASGALRRSPGPFVARHGRLASGRILVRVTMGPPISWSSYNNTRPVFERLEAMGVSWPTGYDGYKGRASLVALQAAPEVRFILEGPL
jgi:hypothetical protein